MKGRQRERVRERERERKKERERKREKERERKRGDGGKMRNIARGKSMIDNEDIKNHKVQELPKENFECT